ncbi:MAG: hypothetical protein M3O34_00440 [Chloroflexota bacterium]|nr:hypothetical protein [Chloroflexota bacterium]
MTIGTDSVGSDSLPPEQQRALTYVMDELTGQWLDAVAVEVDDDELGAIDEDDEDDEDGVPIPAVEHPVLATLPSAYSDRYTPYVVRRFATCAIMVGWKLAQPEPYVPACLAEAMVLRAAVRAVRERAGESGGELALAQFGRAVLSGADVESLYAARRPADADEPDEELDGWFEPFRDRDPVHPYVVPRGEDDEGGPDDLFDLPPLGDADRGAALGALAELLAGGPEGQPRSAGSDLLDRQHVHMLAYLDAINADVLESDPKVRKSEQELARLLAAKLRRLGIPDPRTPELGGPPLPIPPYLAELIDRAADEEE